MANIIIRTGMGSWTHVKAHEMIIPFEIVKQDNSEETNNTPEVVLLSYIIMTC